MAELSKILTRAMASALLVLGALVLGGCTPSLRMVHQSTTYFEQCHAADLDREMSIPEKRACWDTWLSHYTIGQTPERVMHARARMDALGRGEEMRALPGTNAERTAAYLANTQTAEGEAEATDASEGRRGPPPPSLRRPPPDTSIGPCQSVCNPRWDRCLIRCGDRGERCVTACQVEYRTCRAACF